MPALLVWTMDGWLVQVYALMQYPNIKSHESNHES